MDRAGLLITGSAGVIGSVLVRGLREQFRVCGLDRAPTPALERAWLADVTDPEQLEEAWREMGPARYLVHLAAVSDASAAWGPVLENNIHGTKVVLEAAVRHGVRRAVFASSNHVTGAYEGNPPELHLRESPPLLSVNHPYRPDGFYGISKLTGEALASYFHDYHGLEVVCLRIGTVLESDDPTGDPRHLRTWLSHRDLVQLVHKSLLATSPFPGFGVYYGVSNNRGRFWDLSNAYRELGYRPRDDASDRCSPSPTD
jgi:nucleoside-diphosphate-sugar epimerase